MVIDMNEKKLNTVAQLRAFLEGTEEVQFDSLGEDKRYVFVAEVVRRLRYRYLLRSDKGVVMRYLERTTGYSRQQLKTRWTRHDECFRSFDKTLTTNCLYCIIIGSPGRTRTSDQRINSPSLYQLSYRGTGAKKLRHSGRTLPPSQGKPL